MRTSFHHQSEAQPPNGTLTAAPIPHLTCPATQSGLCGPCLSCGIMLTRGDVQEWLAEIERKSAEEQKEATASTLFWAKVAAWAGIIGIVVTIVIALLGR